MASTIEDEDVKTAFQAHFALDSALKAAIPGGMTDGVVVAGTARPYAKITCTQGPRANEYMAPVVTGQGYHDFRKVTITITGIKADVVTALGLLATRFDWQPKSTGTGESNKAMTVPNTRALLQVMPLPGSTRMELDKTRLEGNTIWNGTVEYQVWTVRTIR